MKGAVMQPSRCLAGGVKPHRNRTGRSVYMWVGIIRNMDCFMLFGPSSTEDFLETPLYTYT